MKKTNINRFKRVKAEIPITGETIGVFIDKSTINDHGGYITTARAFTSHYDEIPFVGLFGSSPVYGDPCNFIQVYNLHWSDGAWIADFASSNGNNLFYREKENPELYEVLESLDT